MTEQPDYMNLSVEQCALAAATLDRDEWARSLRIVGDELADLEAAGVTDVAALTAKRELYASILGSYERNASAVAEIAALVLENAS